MPNLYVTADAIGTETGGGSVTFQESLALRAFEPDLEVWPFPDAQRPWGADAEAAQRLRDRPDFAPDLAHFYSGTFSETIAILKQRGTTVTYTAAAHDIAVSRAQHELLGIPFDYPHLTDATLWGKYVDGYLKADQVFVPSRLSMKCMQSYGCNESNISIIPHGVHLPEHVDHDLTSRRFSVAYLGQPGPDKGLIYLLEAWKLFSASMTDYPLLTIAGRGTEHLLPLVRTVGGGCINIRGWVERPSEIYRNCTVYVQPSASEGFGLEVLEAMSHGRPVICSSGAGAVDIAMLTRSNAMFKACDSKQLANVLWMMHTRHTDGDLNGRASRAIAEDHSWELVREMYQSEWRRL